MVRDLSDCLDAIYDLRRAYEDALAGRNIDKALREADSAYQAAVQSIERNRQDLDMLFSRARASLSQQSEAGFAKDVEAQGVALVDAETHLARPLRAKRRHVEIALRMTLRTGLQKMLKTIQSTDDLLGILGRNHEKFRREVEEIRAEDPSRNEKKRRKNELKRSAFSTVFGAGIIVANAHVPPLGQYSYAAGIASILQGGRELIGT